MTQKNAPVGADATGSPAYGYTYDLDWLDRTLSEGADDGISAVGRLPSRNPGNNAESGAADGSASTFRV